MKLRAAACLYAALLLALGAFAGSALAGDNGHGGGSDNGHGNQPSQQSQPSQQTTTTTSSDNSTGVKPSNKTNSDPGHDTHAPASSNKTKQYGNGKTAGQIATHAGYGDSTLHGPGNSQPHKVDCGGHEVDVHALKNKKCGSTEGAKHEEHPVTPQTPKTPEAPAPAPSKPADHKVTICHATGSQTNPYVEITVDYHALKNGHTAAKGDIIPAPAGGCPKPAPATSAPAAVQSVTKTENCTETKVIDKVVVLGVRHYTGPKGSNRYVVIHPNPHSSHYRDKHPDAFETTTIPTTVTVASACPSKTVTESVTTTAAAAVAPTPPAPSAPAPAPAAPAAPAAAPTAAGGVLGEVTPLSSPAKPKATGGVLGSIVRLGKRSGGSTLPFTGLPLWIFALVAAGLILVGAVARRAGNEA